jgi:hypothetical protein
VRNSWLASATNRRIRSSEARASCSAASAAACSSRWRSNEDWTRSSISLSTVVNFPTSVRG